MKKIFIGTSLLVSLLCMYGCNRDEIVNNPPVIVNTTKGAYILSEGTFNPGTSKLSFYNRTRDSFYVSIFNPGTLGITPDGMILNGNNLYITEQGSGAAGKLYKTDTNGTVLASRNIGVKPYSLTTSNDKLYITNGPSNSVSVFDKNSFASVKTITAGIYPQEILAIGNKVFVCNTSLFGGPYDSTVSVIDAVTDSLVATIIVRKSPSALALTTDGKLLVGCPGDVSNAAIYKIDPVTYNKLDSFTNLTFGFCRDISVSSSNSIFYIGGDIYAEAGIISYNLSLRTSNQIISQPSNGLNYSLAYDAAANQIYVGFTPANFTSSGSFIIYNTIGVQQKIFSITDGIAPRRIVIKN